MPQHQVPPPVWLRAGKSTLILQCLLVRPDEQAMEMEELALNNSIRHIQKHQLSSLP